MFGILGLKKVLYVAAFLVFGYLLWLGANFVSDKYEAEATAARLSIELTVQKQENAILKHVAAQAAAAEKTADAVVTELADKEVYYDSIRRMVADTKGTQDGQIAPILRDALRAVDGLH